MLMRLRNSKVGFTLIELMIVLAVIAILASIAIPNFMIYRENKLAEQSLIEMKSNIKQNKEAAKAEKTNPTTQNESKGVLNKL